VRTVRVRKPRKVEGVGRASIPGQDEFELPCGLRDKLDCTVRTVAVAAGIPYADAHALMELVGRKPRHVLKAGVWKDLVENKELLALVGIRFEWAGMANAFVRRRLSTVLERIRGTPGRYVLHCRGHVFAVVVHADGRMESSDAWLRPGYLIDEVWRAVP
jgi:hypothetical protein